MNLIEQILDKNNIRQALEKVIANKGATGIDGMKVEELRGYMNANWPGIKQSILQRSYKPAPVKEGRDTQTEWRSAQARHTYGS